MARKYQEIISIEQAPHRLVFSPGIQMQRRLTWPVACQEQDKRRATHQVKPLCAANYGGFTLIEFMTALAVATILLSLGIPGLHGMLQRLRLTTTVNAFYSAASLARSEAIRRGTRVDLVPRDGSNWAQGWVVFIDENNNQTMENGEHVVSSHGPVPRGMGIKSVLTDSSKPYLAYNSNGRTRTNLSSYAPQFGTISFVLDHKVRRIKLNFAGRARICNPENDKTCTGFSETD